MPLPTATRRPAPHYSALRHLVARHLVAAFLSMVFSINVAVALVPFLTRRDVLPFDLTLSDSLGPILGVALPAFVVVAATGGREGVRELASRSLRWRAGLRWYLFAFLSVPVAVLLCAGAVFGMDLLNVLAERWQLWFTEVLPRLAILILFFIVAEEVGFLGFLQARWQERYGPLKASIFVTLPFAIYHLPVLMADSEFGLAQLHIALAYLGVLGFLQMFGRVVVMWLYNATGASVLLVGLWHSGFDATTAAFGRTFAVSAESAFLTGFWIPSAVVIAFAVLVVIFTRGRLAYRPERASQPVGVVPQKGAPLAHQ